MPKAEVGTPKWLANKMRAKGLQKLKWYCQMCEKQCRDENGFKCHRLSEGHQRQMQVFCSNAHRFMDSFSKTFEHSFMQLMRTRYCRTRVLANTVYQELISDKQHVHMNATIWVTLSEFVLYLGRQGKCKVEHTPKGWYLEYIDQEKIKREKDTEDREKNRMSLEQRHQILINKLIRESKSVKGGYKEPEYTNMKKNNENVVIRIDDKEKRSENPKVYVKNNVFSEKYEKGSVKKVFTDKHEPKSVMEKLASKGPLLKRPLESKNDLLIQTGIVVKVLSKDKNHGKKCRVINVNEKRYVCNNLVQLRCWNLMVINSLFPLKN
ncbi:Domain of Kin17 curved DNA-binding protein [Babesia microti strain RI]|uniref:Domain of Kin17 curved DNA-binding protein n=1 Tax=Babesia microti (strain RI) TaxID=1133968 RepID=A0A1R4A9U2_BABMR|nr:Domain of Kin17 curved DNA-binding protein [Babesia microti strain RI]SJK85760.1 Domain of Kin17 curved DNA-binding protein [Babesia microti strain RI]|eukprot:XP_021337983.1 Domain of Kin17 curved DNA-binding protein [Babesia microti strain RI]